ncbi:calcium-translocating P-type ATPase, PMCA-type [Clostridium celatum]|uniref:calcium-translocating P-type ATPase, PMCA-type n=1 Tax=Clostridium celatum TaxID=36834 RepID=UPI00189ABF4C|nr:calcium-translocating P-type ATPase, PMCA-type [Clostridium celatum]MCE9655170.1 calcium-translocating P-type ATPase, PMCA-type [Clostridium celatum]MDU3721917.1 calcium-translocating P-type ATPase, PMCA-type [Clostridium celatum]MDU6294888.1 calcium-translocating P-type ATPase, PMCA-type [Clostridium celatum]MDY3361946.1 calcium-translocating P-type ATPase, PMCA-type [Clostridium celatum]
MLYKKEYTDVLKEVDSSINGISEEEAKNRLNKYGYNELKEGEKTPIWKMFLENFKDPLVIILLIAAIVQMFLGEFVESLIIFVVVILNAVLGVTQTRKAESSLDSLKKLSSPNAKVIRNGKKSTIPVKELVVGDIVFLEAGDYIPADGRLIEAQTLKVVEGMLTGEAEAVLKHTDRIEEEVAIGDQRNMVFSGATVVYGRGTLVVTATGMNTEVGKVATLLESAGSKQTPLQQKLDDFGKKLGIIIMILAAVIFGIQVVRGYFAGNNFKSLIFDSFMFAIAVAVAAIPEALSSIVTIVLAVGTKDMAKRQAIIRKLPAVETLGSTSVICTDKTGTLTQNKMTVVDFYMYGVNKDEVIENRVDGDTKEQVEAINLGSTLCNDSEITNTGKEIGDPTEVALLRFATKRGIDYKEIREKYDRLNEIPFDSDRKLMSTVNAINGNAIMFTKGAPDVVFARSSKALNDGEEINITEEIKNKYREKNEEFSNKALRVLAFAIKDVPDENFVPCLEDEVDMTLVGVMAMIDPPREQVYDAVKEAIGAGIKTIMITGDHKTTAAAIAKDIGIMKDGDKALTGKELDDLSELELDKELEHISVYARVSPENKIRIVKAWQKKGCITAMTGDGVNDAPALKQANIGIGMGSGTDVAKDASAMILTDDNFATIVAAIEVGRTVYSNIKKSITYLFAGNLGAIIAIIFAVFVNWPNPFTALQLLFINLINDSLPAIALGLEMAEPNIMKEKPRDVNEGILAGGTWQAVLVRGIIIGVVVISSQYIGDLISPELGTSMAFSTVTLARIFQTLPARSDYIPILKLGLFKNKYVIGAIGICLLLYCVVLIPGVRGIFAIPNTFGLLQFGICLGLALLSALIMDLIKFIIKNRN